MTKAQWLIYLSIIVAFVFGTALVMEWYKKKLRKDKAKSWECQLIGLGLSAFCTFALIELNIMRPIITLIGGPVWADYVIYLCIFYFLQYQSDMKLIKALTRVVTRNFLRQAGLSDSEIDELYKLIKERDNIDKNELLSYNYKKGK